MSPLRFIAWLRDATAEGEDPCWDIGAIGGIDPGLLSHLVPPQHSSQRWRAGYRYGLCYYRRGPGFLVVYDERPVSTAVELLLNGSDEVALFTRLLQPGPLSPGDPAACRLRAARLLAEAGGMAVVLPYRQTRLALPLDVARTPSNLLIPASMRDRG